MRTSVLGLHHKGISDVIASTRQMCQVTHTDPRCQASCVAVTVAIATMMKHFDAGAESLSAEQLQDVIEISLSHATDVLRQSSAEYSIAAEVVEGHVKELNDAINVTDVTSLQLDERNKIGYTFKTLGAGFWALKQATFRDAIETVTMEAGDADTNCAVAGALLGCKLGLYSIPPSWRQGLTYKDWLDKQIQSYLELLKPAHSHDVEET